MIRSDLSFIKIKLLSIMNRELKGMAISIEFASELERDVTAELLIRELAEVKIIAIPAKPVGE